jgi:hypothetical protein
MTTLKCGLTIRRENGTKYLGEINDELPFEFKVYDITCATINATRPPRSRHLPIILQLAS